MKRGDRIVHSNFGARKHGVIVKVAKDSAQVRFDGANKDEKLYLDSLRTETAEDVARRDHEAAMVKWRDQEPKTKLARVMMSAGYANQVEIGATMSNLAKTPAEMREAARELVLLAGWFEKRPVGP